VGGECYELKRGAGNGKFICPKCSQELSGVNGLRRHIVRCQTGTGSLPQNERPETGNVTSAPQSGTSDRQSFGFEVSIQWRVAICKNCKDIVDPSHIVTHISKVHGMDIPDLRKLHSSISTARLRSHLAVISHAHETTNVDD
ncbi:hypothetical protein V1509DRAFT_554050, partial [Lipomyces kononenkoae]